MLMLSDVRQQVTVGLLKIFSCARTYTGYKTSDYSGPVLYLLSTLTFYITLMEHLNIYSQNLQYFLLQLALLILQLGPFQSEPQQNVIECGC